jgi:hypothetical protein
MPKKIKAIVDTDVNCSSSGDYFIQVHGRIGDERFAIDIDSSGISYFHKRKPNRWGDRSWSEVPKRKYPDYLYAEVAAALGAVTPEEWSFFEYDRDGNERRDELRYHHRPSFDGLVEWAIEYVRNYNKRDERKADEGG